MFGNNMQTKICIVMLFPITLLIACGKTNEVKEQEIPNTQTAVVATPSPEATPEVKEGVQYFTENEENCQKIDSIAPSDKETIAKSQGVSISTVHFYKANWASDAFGRPKCIITVDTVKGPMKCSADRFIKSDDGTYGIAVLDNNVFTCS